MLENYAADDRTSLMNMNVHRSECLPEVKTDFVTAHGHQVMTTKTMTKTKTMRARNTMTTMEQMTLTMGNMKRVRRPVQ
eukprot:746286-Hanusia_phi.AAC.4